MAKSYLPSFCSNHRSSSNGIISDVTLVGHSTGSGLPGLCGRTHNDQPDTTMFCEMGEQGDEVVRAGDEEKAVPSNGSPPTEPKISRTSVMEGMFLAAPTKPAEGEQNEEGGSDWQGHDLTVVKVVKLCSSRQIRCMSCRACWQQSLYSITPPALRGSTQWHL